MPLTEFLQIVKIHEICLPMEIDEIDDYSIYLELSPFRFRMDSSQSFLNLLL